MQKQKIMNSKTETEGKIEIRYGLYFRGKKEKKLYETLYRLSNILSREYGKKITINQILITHADNLVKSNTIKKLLNENKETKAR